MTPNPIQILHVEDSDLDAILIEEALGENRTVKYVSHRTVTLDETLFVLQSSHIRFDVILLDLNLPDSIGIETLQKIRTFNNQTAIVVVTGAKDEKIATEAVQSGAQDYVIKDEINSRLIDRSVRYSIERQRHDNLISEWANNDQLTGLANRPRFMHYLEHALSNAERINTSLALLYMDCDHFKLVNDTLGHSKGDEYLKKLSATLRSCVRHSDLIARLGGDEFVVALFTDKKVLQSPQTVAEKILNSLKGGITLDTGENLSAQMSIGITTYDGRGRAPTTERFLQEADLAMYSSKSHGGGRATFFDEKLAERAEKRRNLINDLATCEIRKQFEVHFQPIFDRSGEVVGAEALLRWRNRKGEFVSPEEFVPAMEEIGLIGDISLWVVRQAKTLIRKLCKAKVVDESFWVSVNVSPVQINDSKQLECLIHELNKQDYRFGSIHLEITESFLVGTSKFMLNSLHELRKRGCKIAIDDFGVGYSSMNYLKNIPADIIKIDKSFVLDSAECAKDGAIVKAMIALGKCLGMQVTVEGIENIEVLNFCVKEGCDYFQGFYCSKPITAAAFCEMKGVDKVEA